MSNFNNTMLDIETLGDISNSVIVSIGAIKFGYQQALKYETDKFEPKA